MGKLVLTYGWQKCVKIIEIIGSAAFSTTQFLDQNDFFNIYYEQGYLFERNNIRKKKLHNYDDNSLKKDLFCTDSFFYSKYAL